MQSGVQSARNEGSTRVPEGRDNRGEGPAGSWREWKFAGRLDDAGGLSGLLDLCAAMERVRARVREARQVMIPTGQWKRATGSDAAGTPS